MIKGIDIEIHLNDPFVEPLVRLFKHPGGDWDPPDPKYRNSRVDPPVGHKDDFAVLYVGSSLVCIAAECKILHEDLAGNYRWSSDRAREYQIVRYTTAEPSLFIPLDGNNRRRLDLEAHGKAPRLYDRFQNVSLDLFQRFGNVVHGMSWESFHRGQPGRVYAIWHHHKGTIGLERTSVKPYSTLGKDTEAKTFLADDPSIEILDSSPPLS